VPPDADTSTVEGMLADGIAHAEAAARR